MLRLVSPAAAAAEVTISVIDDDHDGDAAPEGDVSITLAAVEARDLSALALESGARVSERVSATARASGALR